MDFYGGFRPGDNLFSTSLIALDVKTGKREWHYQLVHHDIWNYDTPVAPVLMDVNVGGRRVPACSRRPSRRSCTRSIARPASRSGRSSRNRFRRRRCRARSCRRRSRSRPSPRRSTCRARDESPHRLHARAEAARAGAREENDLFSPFFNPPVHRGNAEGKNKFMCCPGDVGGVNITGPPAADPTAGVIFITSTSGCGNRLLIPGRSATRRSSSRPARPSWTGRRAGGGGVAARRDDRRFVDLEGTARPHRRDRSQHRRAPLDDSERRSARPTSAIIRCSRPERSRPGTERPRGDAGDADAC